MLLYPNALFAADTAPILSIGIHMCGKIFLIRIFENGLVEYTGVRGTASIGTHEKRISPSRLNTMINRMEMRSNLEYFGEYIGAVSVEDIAVTTKYGKPKNMLQQWDLFAETLRAAKLEKWSGWRYSDFKHQALNEKWECRKSRQAIDAGELRQH